MTRLLIFLLILASTIHYRVELRGFSFTLMEPIILAVSAILFAHQLLNRRTLLVLKDWLVYLFLGITLWAALIRPWAVDWQHGLSDVRDWAIPVLGFVALTSTIRHGWRKWIALFVIWAFVNALLGAYQHLTDSFRPFVAELAALKTGFTLSPDEDRLALVSYATGLFSHPNGFAMYLFMGLMMALGWLADGRHRGRKLVLVATIAFGLFWTYAKASLLVIGFAIGLFWLARRVKPEPRLVALMGAALALGAVGLIIGARLVPDALLLTFDWRVGLWRTALDVVAGHPEILIIGNGMDIFARQAYYAQPHNLYLYLLLEYGMVGLLWVALVIWRIWVRGWQLRRTGLMAREPMLAALWIALLSYFGIGLVESNLLGIESRMIFLFSMACLVGLSRELSVEIRARAVMESERHAGAAVARPRPI
jgi:O-antigen ligase